MKVGTVPTATPLDEAVAVTVFVLVELPVMICVEPELRYNLKVLRWR